jgi:hypothetical protein
LANRIRKKSHAVLQLRDALELKGRPAPRDTRQTDIKVLCTLRLARIFATWSLQVDGTIRALGPIVMSYPVRTRLTREKALEAWTMTNDATRISSAGSTLRHTRGTTAV